MVSGFLLMEITPNSNLFCLGKPHFYFYLSFMRFFLFAFFLISLPSLSQTNEAADSVIIKANNQIFLEHIPNDSIGGYFVMRDSVSGTTKALRIKLTTKPAMGSVLEIFNPHESPFTYKAFLYNFKKKKYLEANVYPVQPKMGVREEWPFPIESILIKEFKFTE